MPKLRGDGLAVYNVDALSLSDGASTGLFVDANGNLLVNVAVGGGGGTSGGATEANQLNGNQKTKIVDTTGAQVDDGAGHLQVIEPLPSVVWNNLKLVATAGTSVALQAQACSTGVVVKALSTNTGFIYVGTSGVVAAANGFQLKAGESVGFAINDVGNVSIDASVSGEGVSWLAT